MSKLHLKTPCRKSVVWKFTLCGLFISSEQKLVPFGQYSFKQNLIASISKLEGYWYVHNFMHKNWMNIPGLKMQALTHAENFFLVMLVFHGRTDWDGTQSHWLLSSFGFVVFLHAHLPNVGSLNSFVTVPKKKCQSWFRTYLDKSKPGAPVRKQNLLHMEKVEETTFSGQNFHSL